MYTAKHARGTPKHAEAGNPMRARGLLRAAAALLIAAALCYGFVLCCPAQPLRYWRDIYIETAMTTAHHKWLATAFIPRPIITEVMAKQSDTVEGVGGLNRGQDAAGHSQAASAAPAAPGAAGAEAAESAAPRAAGSGAESPQSAAQAASATPQPAQSPAPAEADILGQAALTVGGLTPEGDTVLVNDRAQGILIAEIRGDAYVAHLALIDDPARVSLAATNDKGTRGMLIGDYLTENHAVLGINASGFADEGGHGTGGEIAGLCYARGEAWGTYKDTYVSFGFTQDNRFLVGKMEDWDAYSIRDGAQFKPALIMDGEIVTAGSNGWGLQPRTCIGQREDGVVAFLVVDGRQPGYSIGATVGDCAEILTRYGVVNAACCDGGSSSVMAYDGKLVGVPSTSMKTTGRWLPDAFVVASR
jgi:exopolysaccharide biosynthesis protein